MRENIQKRVPLLSRMHVRVLVKHSSELPAVWKLTDASKISGDFPARVGNSQVRNSICQGTTQPGFLLLTFPGEETLEDLKLCRSPAACSLDHLLIGQHSFFQQMHWRDYQRHPVWNIGFLSNFRENHGCIDSQACRLQLTILHFLTYNSVQNPLTWHFWDSVYPSWFNDWLLPRVSSQ